MEEDYQNFTYAESEILVNIYLKSGSPDMLNISQLAEIINTSVNNPKFQSVLKVLVEDKIIIVDKVIGSSKFITIDYGELGEAIKKTKMAKIMGEFYIVKQHGIILRA